MKIVNLISVLLLTAIGAFAQNIEIRPTVTPTFFAADEEITISYNVTGTTAQNWDDAWLWLWLPDQTSASIASNVNPADSNPSATDAAKFTKSTVEGQHFMTIKLTPTDFTGLAKDNINQLGMLIKGNDWGDGQSIDFVTNVTNEFTVQFSNPTGTFDFYESGTILALDIRTSEPADISLYVDETLLASAENVSELTNDHAIISDGEMHVLKAVATAGNDTDEVTYTYSLSPQPEEVALPSGMIDGVNYMDDDTKATLVLTAPNKSHIYILGDFNDWTVGEDYLMHTDGEKHWRTIENLVSGKEYVFQYLIDGDVRVADPYTDKVSDPWDDQYIEDEVYPNLITYPSAHTSHRASVLQTGQVPYDWKETAFEIPEKEDLVIYELLIRDFDEAHTYQSVIDKLDYLEGLGINALELMPVNEFEGNQSWGYNPNFYFAPDKYYGHKDDLKALIDECHSRGIAVIIDMVLNHSFNSSPLARMYWNEGADKPSSDSPWYNENHNFQNSAAHWGADFNHESLYMQALVDSVNSYWMTEYKVDGFRFDFTKGFGNKFKSQSSDEWGSKYDADRIALLKRMADKIWEVKSDAIVSFEHLAENSEEKELANHGILLWGNMNHDYRNLAKGLSRTIEWAYHEKRGWDEPNVIAYMESHDEERVMWDVLKTTEKSQALIKLQLNAAFFLTIPGPKMIWQFGEMGYDEELNDDRLAIKPTHWEYLEEEERKKLFDVYTALSNLKTKTGYIDSDYFTWSGTDYVKWMAITHPEVQISIVGNFDRETITTNAHLTSNGTWYDYLTGEAIEVDDYENFELDLAAGRFKILTSESIDNYITSNPIILGDRTLQSELKIFPNPAGNTVRIQTSGVLEAVSVLDMQGRTMKKSELAQAVHSINLTLDGLEAGIYFINLKVDGKQTIRRFIKK